MLFPKGIVRQNGQKSLGWTLNCQKYAQTSLEQQLTCSMQKTARKNT